MRVVGDLTNVNNVSRRKRVRFSRGARELRCSGSPASLWTPSRSSESLPLCGSHEAEFIPRATGRGPYQDAEMSVRIRLSPNRDFLNIYPDGDID